MGEMALRRRYGAPSAYPVDTTLRYERVPPGTRSRNGVTDAPSQEVK